MRTVFLKAVRTGCFVCLHFVIRGGFPWSADRNYFADTGKRTGNRTCFSDNGPCPGGLAYVPVAGVGMVMVVLEAVCSWIWKFYMGNSDSLKAFYKRPDYKWSAFDESYRGGESNDSEVHIHYFKGIKNLEELKRRYGALLRIYHPVNDFGEDEINQKYCEGISLSERQVSGRKL